MKFGKELGTYILKYKDYICGDKWFNYKIVKKIIKNISIIYPNIINNIKTYKYNYDNEECCICLENRNLMQTFCCHNYIHHNCLVKSLAFSNPQCPLCRITIKKVLLYNVRDKKESFDSEILSLIGRLYQEIEKIKSCNKELIKNKNIIKIYKDINLKAIIKICKKIKKMLAIDIKESMIKKLE